jgi:hypothetical protein
MLEAFIERWFTFPQLVIASVCKPESSALSEHDKTLRSQSHFATHQLSKMARFLP